METTHNINNIFGPGTANEYRVQQWFRKFCNENESLEDEEHNSGWPSEVDNNQLRTIIEADRLTTTQEVAQELIINHFVVVRDLKHIGKVKKLDKCMSHELTENKKQTNIIFKFCFLLFYETTRNYFSVGLWYATKEGRGFRMGNTGIPVVD